MWQAFDNIWPSTSLPTARTNRKSHESIQTG